MSTDAQETEELKARLATLTAAHPAEAMFSIMEALIEITIGVDPLHRDHRRKWLYVGILQNLAKKGIR